MEHFPRQFLGIFKCLTWNCMGSFNILTQCCSSMLCCSWVKNICTNPDMQNRALSWLVIEIHTIQGGENQRRQVNTGSVYFFFLFPKRDVRIIRVSEKGKKYIWKEKQIRKCIWRSFSQELFSVTYLCVWPRHAIRAWCITCPSWYLRVSQENYLTLD